MIMNNGDELALTKEITVNPSISAPTGLRATWTGKTDSNTRTYSYIVTAVDEETMEESVRSAVVSATGHREANWLTDEYMTITWTAVAGAAEYNVYRNVNGIYGYIGTAEGTSFTDENFITIVTDKGTAKRIKIEHAITIPPIETLLPATV